jgi:phage-related minor tail protein
MEFLKSILSEKTLKSLNDLLGEDTVKQINEKTKDFKIDVAEEKFIPKAKFDEVNTQLKEQKDLVTARDKQINDLGTKAKGNEELTKKIEELQAQNAKTTADYEAKISAREREVAMDRELQTAKVKNSKAVSALLDHSKITFKDGKIEGLNEQIEALKKSDAYLFDEANPGVPPKAGGKVNPPANPSDQFADLRKM